MARVLFSCLLLVAMVSLVWCHGRLVAPPSRASAWRFGFDTPKDYNDTEGFCGGIKHQWSVHGGKCGICGDPWEESPREHEAGGKYATGTIVETYQEGQVIKATVEITSNHKGHFEFRICPNNNYKVEATQTCLDDHPLYLADGSGSQYQLPSGNGKFNVDLKLPKGLVCSQCVLQWRYVAGNNWGTCPNGTGAVGCGNQEEFRACADVAILAGDGTASESSTTTSTSANPAAGDSTTTTTTTPTTTTTTTGAQTGTLTCVAVGAWQTVSGMDAWCQRNCNLVPKYCPASHCKCT
ncbi:uncharacterized protein LOC143018462 [Oratosquilla oratoria]|uniref:uncharacterized protein LOC143018462 n=1 Tax=Oratosquilla oratoria TaxID=337810 RepID=UPI003F76618A